MSLFVMDKCLRMRIQRAEFEIQSFLLFRSAQRWLEFAMFFVCLINFTASEAVNPVGGKELLGGKELENRNFTKKQEQKKSIQEDTGKGLILHLYS